MYELQRRLVSWVLTGLIIGFVFTMVSNCHRKHAEMSEPITIKSPHRKVMGTFAQVTVVAADVNIVQAATEAAFASLEHVDTLMSDYDPNSELSRVNRDAFKNPIKVSPETFEVLRRSVYWSKRSGGEFDVTIGPLVDLWHRAAEANSIPDEDEIAATRARVGYEKMLLDANSSTVRFAVEGMRIDLGAIAKGYGVDLAVEAMKTAGALGGMVEAGGDLRCFGAVPQGRKSWNIGLQDPALADEDAMGTRPRQVLAINDKAVTTSGDYFRYSRVGSKNVSHIIDPNNGQGSEEFSSVTIIAANATDADALATAVSVLGVTRGMALVNDIKGAEAIMIGHGPDFEIIESKKARKDYLREIDRSRQLRYKVKKASGTVVIDGNWNGPQWKDVESVKIDKYMGDEPEHQPDTQAKVMYDDKAVYVMFKVDDKYIRAVAGHQGNVSSDSCVEFFFTPGTDIENGYFNVELNCGGTMLFHFQVEPWKDSVKISEEDCNSMQVYASMPQTVEPEQVGEKTWIVAYRIPVAMLSRYSSAIKPASGVVWRANFYKCGDATSHPHWLTWNKVEKPKPDFHVPQCFGELEFE